MASDLDVSRLAVARDDPHASVRHDRGRIALRYILPAVVAAAFLAVIGWSVLGNLLPSREVTVLPVVVRRAGDVQAGATLFTAAGWVEARPSPVLVSALAEGVVDRVLVVEDQAVRAGEAVARLIDADALLALEQVRADVKAKQAALESAQAALIAAQTNFENPVQLQSALAEANSQLAKAETELASLPYEIRTADAALRLARQILQRKRDARDVVPASDIAVAESQVEAAGAEAERLVAREPLLKVERAALSRRTDAIARQLELKSDESLALANAQAGVKAAQAQLEMAEVARREAELRLKRMTIQSPIAGRVLDVIARPGTRVAGNSGGFGNSGRSSYKSSTVVTLYDPQRLQIRADVLLEDIPHVRPGQPVRIETAAVQGPLSGEVLFATSEANIQKNTLEVKIAVTDPPAVLKPEMLTQVTFLAAERSGQDDTSHAELRIFVPDRLVVRADGEPFVWITDPDSRAARRQTVVVGSPGGDGLVEIQEGLNVTSKLIVRGRETLRDGQPITVVGEDETMGGER